MRRTLSLFAILFLATQAFAGDEMHKCPPGETPNTADPPVCVACNDATISTNAGEHGFGCSECNRDEAKCVFCNSGFGIKADGTCETCDGSGIGGADCLHCIRLFDPKFRGCNRCAADTNDAKYMMTYDGDGGLTCSNCGENLDSCTGCGAKNVNNCKVCHKDFGCAKCAGNFWFKDGGVEHDGHLYGECSVCHWGWTSKDPSVVTCDVCKEGFREVDGHCVEINDAHCGDKIIQGCQFCGEMDETKCKKCAPGYGLSGPGEAEGCQICKHPGCADCAPDGWDQKCLKCVWHPEHDDPHWCFDDMSTALIRVGAAILALFAFLF